MFVEMFSRDRPVCFAASAGMIFFFYYLYPAVFSSVCLSTIFAALLIFYLPLTVSAFSGARKVNKSVARYVGTTYYAKMEMPFSRVCLQAHRIAFRAVGHCFNTMDSQPDLNQIHFIF